MDATSSRECRVVIEHHQLIGFEDVEFSPAFTRACKQDMDDFCSELTEKNQKPDKAELLECLAEAITENGLGRDLFPDLGKPSATDQLREVSAQCRAQIHREFLQQRADPKLDPLVNKACEADIKKFGCTGLTLFSVCLLQMMMCNHEVLLFVLVIHYIIFSLSLDVSCIDHILTIITFWSECLQAKQNCKR